MLVILFAKGNVVQIFVFFKLKYSTFFVEEAKYTLN